MGSPNAKPNKSSSTPPRPSKQPPRQRSVARASAQAKRRSSKKGPSSSAWLWAGGIALLVVAGILAVALTRSSSTSTPAASEFSPSIQVQGTPLPALPATGTDPAVGQVTPVVTGNAVPGFASSPLTIPNDNRPKVVVTAAPWCPHCNNELPLLLNYVKSSQRSDVDLYIIVTAASPQRANWPPSEWLSKMGWPSSTKALADDEKGDAMAAYGVTGFPTTALVDSSNKVVKRLTGEGHMEEFKTIYQSLK